MKIALKSLFAITIWSLVACWLGEAPIAFGQVSVVTYHNDNGRTGQNINETTLTLSNVKAISFKKLFTGSVTLDSWAAAQPLYVPNVTIGGTQHNVVFVATLNNSVYAFDADNGSQLWMQNYGPPTPFTSLCHDSAFQTSPSQGAGIIGTPAIDPVAGTIYFVAKTGTGVTGSPYQLVLHAVDYTNGTERSGSPALVNPTSAGPRFYSRYQENRPGLLLNNGIVYVGLGSTGCTGLRNFPAINNHGYVLGFNATNLRATTPSVFVTTPSVNHGGIWQAGGGLVADSNGHIYFETADAPFDQNTGGLDFGDSILELDASLNFVDFFTPYNANTLLNPADLDLGSVGPVLLPDQVTGPAHLLVGTGKAEEIYVLNRDNMGGFCSTCTTTNTNIVQNIQRPSYLSGCQQPPTGLLTCRYGALSYWNNRVYAPGTNSPLLAYPLSNGVLATTPTRSVQGYGAVDSPSISANGTTNGIAWIVTVGPPPVNNGALRAFDAVTLKLLYTSDQATGGRDTLGPVAHFVTPTIANGKVYVATHTQLVVYGPF